MLKFSKFLRREIHIFFLLEKALFKDVFSTTSSKYEMCAIIPLNISSQYQSRFIAKFDLRLNE